MLLCELEATLDRLGIVLSPRGDRLHIRAPNGTMTPEIRFALRVHKGALLRQLAKSSQAQAPAKPASPETGPTLRPVYPVPDWRRPDMALVDPEVLRQINAEWGCPPIAGRAQQERGPRDVRQGDRWLSWHNGGTTA
jgi:hypothetical protein